MQHNGTTEEQFHSSYMRNVIKGLQFA